MKTAKAASRAAQASAARGTGARGASPNATAARTPHQTRMAATLRTSGGAPPPSRASTTTRDAMRGTRANRRNEPNGRRERRSLSAARVAAPVMALVLLTILPPAGMAAPSNDPAVDQYVESVPGAGGDRAPNSEPRSGGERLPSDVSSEIERSGGDGRRGARGGGELARARRAQGGYGRGQRSRLARELEGPSLDDRRRDLSGREQRRRRGRLAARRPGLPHGRACGASRWREGALCPRV